MKEENVDVLDLEDELYYSDSLPDFLNLMIATEEPVKVEIGEISKILFQRYRENISEVVEFIHRQLGRIEIQRESRDPFSVKPGRIIGIKFTASKLLNEVLRERESKSDLIIQVRPQDPPPLQSGLRSFVSGLMRAKDQIVEAPFYSLKVGEIDKVIQAVDSFVEEAPYIRMMRDDVKKIRDDCMTQLGKRNKGASGEREEEAEAPENAEQKLDGEKSVSEAGDQVKVEQ
jgi:hypothetical protein